MADTILDGYMYFAGEGRHRLKDRKYKSIGEIKGETSDDKFRGRGAFQIDSFKIESVHDKLGDDRLDPRVSVGAFTVTKEVDIATPSLFYAHATCSVFPGVHIYYRKAAGPKAMTFYHAIFSDVIIEKWEIDLESTNKETLTCNFNWIELNYYPQTLDGARRKDSVANMKQYCTSDPDSQDTPWAFRRPGKEDGGVQDGDLDFLFGG